MAAIRSGGSTVKAPPVLFLHGQPGGSYDWAMVIDALGSRARTIAVDRPGWDGRSRGAGRALRVPSSWRAFTVEQRALIRELPALEASLREIAIPTTIVIGSVDRIVRPSSARRLADQIPGAQLVVVEDGNHLLAAEHA